MLLRNVTLVNTHEPVNILVSANKITEVGKQVKSDGGVIDFSSAMVFPGLINSHDHLDFNCFVPLGREKYNNYTEWGNHIHAARKPEINAVLKIPQELRIAWGMYKNLLAGVTTVVNHGVFLSIENPLITIYQEPQSLHSVRFQQKWKWKLNNPLLKKKLCVIHTGEGTDKASTDEINELLKWNLFKRKLVGIHGVGMNKEQAKKFSGLVWCPESNRVLLHQHADIKQIKENTKVVFGTDSTLTGHWNIWRHLRLARKLQLADDATLFAMVTNTASDLWQLNNGSLQPGKDADIVIAASAKGYSGWDTFYSVDPENILLVMQHGKIRLFDETIRHQLKKIIIDTTAYHPVCIGPATKFVEGDVPGLIRSIKSYHPAVILPGEISNPSKNLHA